jgi:serine/threonine protein phosphatase PrpC
MLDHESVRRLRAHTQALAGGAQLALDRGGRDNVTVVVVGVRG